MVLDKTSPDLQVFEQFPDREHTHLISLEVQIPGPSATCGAGLWSQSLPQVQEDYLEGEWCSV